MGYCNLDVWSHIMKGISIILRHYVQGQGLVMNRMKLVQKRGFKMVTQELLQGLYPYLDIFHIQYIKDPVSFFDNFSLGQGHDY